MNFKTGLLLLTFLSLFSCKQDVKFDSVKWSKAGGENISLDSRWKMTKDLIESEILLNKSENEIIELIGTPSILRGKEIDTIKYYAVQEIYGWDVDPKEMTFLKIIFNDKRRSTSVGFYSTK